MLSNSKAFVVLMVIGVVVFANSLHNAFLIDDHAFFTGQRVTAARLFLDFVPDVHNMMTAAANDDSNNIHFYRPLAHLVPMFSYLIFGNNVVGHHALNLLLWVTAAWMVFIFLEFLFKDRVLALAVASLYMVHPINGVLVNYITADVFSVQVICMLASVWFLLRSFPGVSVFFFVLALLCHETAMALPFYATAIFVTARSQSWKQALNKTKWLWLTLGFYFLWRLKFASLADGIFGKFLDYHMNVFEYLATISKLIIWYISKLFWPIGIIMIKAQPVLRGPSIIAWLGILVILAGGWAWLLRRNRRVPMPLTGLSWFAVGFLPFCFASLFRPTFGLMIEPHWFVFPVIGFFLWLVYTLRSLCKPDVFKQMVIALGICLSVISWMMNRFWDGDLDYCRYWTTHSPGFSSPSYYMAMAYEASKNYEKARQWYSRVLVMGQYRPEIIYTALGYVDFMENRLVDAKSELNKAITLDPQMAPAFGDLGIVAFMEKDYPKAQGYFSKAIALDRFDLLSRLNLGKVYLQLGQTDEAISAFEEALAVHPESKDAIKELVMVGMSAQKNNDMKTAQYVYQVLMKSAPHGLSQ